VAQATEYLPKKCLPCTCEALSSTPPKKPKTAKKPKKLYNIISCQHHSPRRQATHMSSIGPFRPTLPCALEADLSGQVNEMALSTPMGTSQWASEWRWQKRREIQDRVSIALVSLIQLAGCTSGWKAAASLSGSDSTVSSLGNPFFPPLIPLGLWVFYSSKTTKPRSCASNCGLLTLPLCVHSCTIPF
jgi:hypothetical protein